MTDRSKELTALKALAKRMSTLAPRNADETALLAFMAGVIYALTRAAQLEFDDARMAPDLSKVPPELRQTLSDVGGDAAPPDPWLSGFYLDSAMMRLAALNERLDKYLGAKRNLASKVSKLVNKLKHDVDAGITDGWKMSFTEVVTTTSDLCGLLEMGIPVGSASGAV